ncbi:MAG: ATP-binding protein [Helicobacteraceae bacterium]|nr:ATP-binding protein [Helicobacteraceae bacterium]
MQNLLQELYKIDLYSSGFIPRKFNINEKSYQISGVSGCGKSSLIKAYLSTLKKSSYIYIDLDDIRINFNKLNQNINSFCLENKVECVVYDNYIKDISLPNVSQLILSSELFYDIEHLEHIKLYPLDFEEFLAYEKEYNETAFSHFLQLGSFSAMHKLHSDDRTIYLQKLLKTSVSEIEFSIMYLIANLFTHNISAFSLYEKLKLTQKISKDKLYSSYESLVQKNYIHELAKFDRKRAVKKVYLCDSALKQALTANKNFSLIFEHIIFLELYKHNKNAFYEDNIEFYLPDENSVIVAMPFGNERTLFKKLESIEAFIFEHNITSIIAITMSHEGEITHPIATVNMIPFSMWALMD